MKALDEVVGHEKLKRVLVQALEAGSLPQSLLFWGPPSVGKKKLARALIKTLVCEARTGCGVCSSCLNLELASQSSLLMVESEANTIKLEKASEILHFVRLGVAHSARGIVVDEAHLATAQAGNLLLKTLEESGKGTYFIFISSQPHRLLTTIRSRLIPFRFLPLSQIETGQILSMQTPLEQTPLRQTPKTAASIQAGPKNQVPKVRDPEDNGDPASWAVSWRGGVAQAQGLQSEEGVQRSLLTRRFWSEREGTQIQSSFSVKEEALQINEQWLADIHRGVHRAHDLGLSLAPGFTAFAILLRMRTDLEQNVDRQLLMENWLNDCHKEGIFEFMG